MLHVAFVSWVVHSRLSLQRLLCCIVFCLSSFCILCSILPVSLGRPLLIVPSTVTLLYSVLFVFVLYLMFHTAFVSRSSTLDCPFSLLCCIVFCLSSFCILCFILHVSLARPLVIAPLVYCVALCFACVRFVSYAPCCLCLWGRPLLFPLQGLLCCIVFCLSSFCILCSILPLSLGSSTPVFAFRGYFVV